MLRKTSENISRFSIISIILGLYFSNALKSIGIVCLAGSILFHPDTVKNFRVLFRNKLFISLFIIAVFYILSLFYGDNYYYYWISSKNKFLYFFVPVALLNLSLRKKEISIIK
ncbi:MAG: hypothetical protein JWN78_2549, partial [Bacteroidota bacterium]|nr:hypothetical protein [Bacteroidota bacterium]